MTDKRKPPISIRLGPTREAAVATLRAKTGLSQSDAIHRLMDHGIAAEGLTQGSPQKLASPKRSRTKANGSKAVPAKPKRAVDPRWVI